MYIYMNRNIKRTTMHSQIWWQIGISRPWIKQYKNICIVDWNHTCNHNIWGQCLGSTWKNIALSLTITCLTTTNLTSSSRMSYDCMTSPSCWLPGDEATCARTISQEICESAPQANLGQYLTTWTNSLHSIKPLDDRDYWTWICPEKSLEEP